MDIFQAAKKLCDEVDLAHNPTGAIWGIGVGNGVIHIFTESIPVNKIDTYEGFPIEYKVGGRPTLL